MNKILLIMLSLLLISTLYIGVVSNVTNRDLRPPTFSYVFEEISSYTFYINSQDSLNDLIEIFNGDLGGDEDGADIPDWLPDWFISIVQWIYETPVYMVFTALYSVIKFLSLAVYDTLLALIYILQIFSVFLTGIPA